MATPSTSVNAWIFLLEDEPSGTNYTSPNSSYQSLIKYGVYSSTDIVSICWVKTVPTGATTVPPGDGTTYTVQLQEKTHPGDQTNQQYMEWVIADSRRVNPNAKVLVMLGYGASEITQIFSGDQSKWPQDVNAFARNLLTYLKHYRLDGFDVDWESPLSDNGKRSQFAMLFGAIREQFNSQKDKHYYLTLSPAAVGTLDAKTVDSAFDFVNLQLYSGFTDPRDFIKAGVSKDLLAYGAKFEPNGSQPYQDAQQAYQGYVDGGYKVITQWRLNSNDFQYEQAQQMILYQLVHGIPGPSFDDTPIIGAAGNPLISQIVVRSGEVLDAIQATNTGTFEGTSVPYTLLQHGGNGGHPSICNIADNDAIVEISGFTGQWFGWNCVLQITIRTRNGQIFGPFGTMTHSSEQQAFAVVAPQGQSVLAFSGSIASVPVAGGGETDIIASLGVTIG